MYGFIICEYEEVKKQFPEFREILESTRRALINKAISDWAPLKLSLIHISEPTRPY